MYANLVNVLLLVGAVVAAPTTSVCNHDNCLRAIIASAFPTRSGTADCQSYFLTTVTPATYTSTVTATTSPTTTIEATITDTSTVIDTLTSTLIIPLTTTTTVLPGPGKVKRDNADLRGPNVTIAPRQVTQAPSGIPSYASACSGSVRYSSACSCIGVTASTITAPTPTAVTTVTATSSQTSLTTLTDLATQTIDTTATLTESVVLATQTVYNCGTTPTFILQAVGGGSDNGLYVQVVAANDGLNDNVIVFTSTAASATHLTIDASGHISAAGFYGNIEAGVQHFLFYFNTASDISAFGYVYATCSLSSTNELLCTDQGSDLFQISPSVVSSGTGGAGVVIGQFIEQGNIPVSFQATCV